MADFRNDTQNFAYTLKMLFDSSVFGAGCGFFYWVYQTNQAWSSLHVAYSSLSPLQKFMTLASALFIKENSIMAAQAAAWGAACGLAVVVVWLGLRAFVKARKPASGAAGRSGDGLQGPRF